MKIILHLLKWDAILFHRNRLFQLALVVALIYTGVFYLLKPLGNLDTILIVLIFNDPVITGYMFAGVLLLFDKSQHTIQAIAVLPIPFRQYLLSKTLMLAIVSTMTALVMTVTIRGFDFNWLHLLSGTFFSTCIFSLIGFSVGALTKTFNQLLIYSIPFLVVCGAPLLPVFGYGKPVWYSWLPSAGGIQLLQASFKKIDLLMIVLSYLHLIVWTVISWLVALRINIKNAV